MYNPGQVQEVSKLDVLKNYDHAFSSQCVISGPSQNKYGQEERYS